MFNCIMQALSDVYDAACVKHTVQTSERATKFTFSKLSDNGKLPVL